MSNDWVGDIAKMHKHYGVNEKVSALSKGDMQKYLAFRLNFIKEEYDETCNAISNADPEEIVDGLIDLCVVAIGTLESMGVDANKAWDEVLTPNMNKEVGVKPSRPNPLGLPDLIKPQGWVGPDHSGNHGNIAVAFSE